MSRKRKTRPKPSCVAKRRQVAGTDNGPCIKCAMRFLPQLWSILLACREAIRRWWK